MKNQTEILIEFNWPCFPHFVQVSNSRSSCHQTSYNKHLDFIMISVNCRSSGYSPVKIALENAHKHNPLDDLPTKIVMFHGHVPETHPTSKCFFNANKSSNSTVDFQGFSIYSHRFPMISVGFP